MPLITADGRSDVPYPLTWRDLKPGGAYQDDSGDILFVPYRSDAEGEKDTRVPYWNGERWMIFDSYNAAGDRHKFREVRIAITITPVVPG
jgi:hypothetical protein